jgi:hypothetical protein
MTEDAVAGVVLPHIKRNTILDAASWSSTNAMSRNVTPKCRHSVNNFDIWDVVIPARRLGISSSARV